MSSTPRSRPSSQERLFDEFPQASYEQWQAEVARQVDAPSPEAAVDSLSTTLDEEIRLAPLYTARDIDTIECLGTMPGASVFTRGRRSVPGRGPLLQALREIHAGDERGDCANDPIGTLALTGQLEGTWETVITRLATELESSEPDTPSLWFHGDVFQQAGADRPAELACTLASAVETLRGLQSRAIDPQQAAPRAGWVMATGALFFPELAKLRAARLLWDRVMEACGVSEEDRGLWIHAHTSIRTLSRIDAPANLLRATTQALCAITGGADSIYVEPYDALAAEQSVRGDRLAHNVGRILLHEAGANRVLDPAGGSWLVEALTVQLAQAAWSRFQQIERAGGMLAALASGIPQRWARENDEREAAAYEAGERVMVGVNKYRDDDKRTRENDAQPSRSDSADAVTPTKGVRLTVRPLPARRVAAPFEPQASAS